MHIIIETIIILTQGSPNVYPKGYTDSSSKSQETILKFRKAAIFLKKNI